MRRRCTSGVHLAAGAWRRRPVSDGRHSARAHGRAHPGRRCLWWVVVHCCGMRHRDQPASRPRRRDAVIWRRSMSASMAPPAMPRWEKARPAREGRRPRVFASRVAAPRLGAGSSAVGATAIASGEGEQGRVIHLYGAEEMVRCSCDGASWPGTRGSAGTDCQLLIIS